MEDTYHIILVETKTFFLFWISFYFQDRILVSLWHFKRRSVGCGVPWEWGVAELDLAISSSWQDPWHRQYSLLLCLQTSTPIAITMVIIIIISSSSHTFDIPNAQSPGFLKYDNGHGAPDFLCFLGSRTLRLQKSHFKSKKMEQCVSDYCVCGQNI